VPLPVPVLELIVIHDAPLVETQMQPAVAVTVTLPLPPLDGNDALAGEIV
jgi:hypothetical protein